MNPAVVGCGAPGGEAQPGRPGLSLLPGSCPEPGPPDPISPCWDRRRAEDPLPPRPLRAPGSLGPGRAGRSLQNRRLPQKSHNERVGLGVLRWRGSQQSGADPTLPTPRRSFQSSRRGWDRKTGSPPAPPPRPRPRRRPPARPSHPCTGPPAASEPDAQGTRRPPSRNAVPTDLSASTRPFPRAGWGPPPPPGGLPGLRWASCHGSVSLALAGLGSPRPRAHASPSCPALSRGPEDALGGASLCWPVAPGASAPPRGWVNHGSGPHTPSF